VSTASHSRSPERRIAAVLGALAISAAALVARPGAAAEIRLPEGPGVDAIYANCRTCHDLQYVRDAKGLLPEQWKAVVASMHDYGLTISVGDEARVLKYLTTYLGPNAPPAAAAAASASATADGATVFARNCAACHGDDGRGRAGAFPSLAGNADIARDHLLPVKVVLHGLAGPIEVAGAHFDSSMPPFDHLADGEIAAVVNYVRNAWGNAKATSPESPITDKTVADERALAMTPAEVLAYRAKSR
jgi:mono/diheme cytochrome c family protein